MAAGAAAGAAAGPAARRLARERGLDLRRVRASGGRARITIDDVTRAASAADAASPVTARADLSNLLDRLPALAALSGQQETPLTPLLIKAAAVALRASPELAPLHIAKGAERWALDNAAASGSLGIRPLTRAAAGARIAASSVHDVMGHDVMCGASLRLDGPVAEAAYRDGVIRARSRLDLTLEGPQDAAATLFVRALVDLLETPGLLLSA
jgi:pyruvate/2-oxoglutarate dehydrogenase complex dihydrolipoamide acyltransferase (E2) component